MMSFIDFAFYGFILLTIIIVGLTISFLLDRNKKRARSSTRTALANPNEVEFYDIRSYGDWNIIQDKIEHRHEWAITYIHRFGHEEEHWEAWGDGRNLSSRCKSLQEAQEVIRDARANPGKWGVH